MRSKSWVLAVGLSAAAVVLAPAAFAATGAVAALGSTTTTTTAAVPAAAVQTLVPREAGLDPGAVRPVSVASPAAPMKPGEPDPSQGPFPTSETLLLLAGLLAVGIIVRRRQ